MVFCGVLQNNWSEYIVKRSRKRPWCCSLIFWNFQKSDYVEQLQLFGPVHFWLHWPAGIFRTSKMVFFMKIGNNLKVPSKMFDRVIRFFHEKKNFNSQKKNLVSIQNACAFYSFYFLNYIDNWNTSQMIQNSGRSWCLTC